MNLTRSSDPQDSADATVASLPPTLPAKAPAKPSLQRSLSISYDVDILGSCGLAGASVVCDSSNIPFDCELTQIRPQLNMDKYYNFQLIKTAEGKYMLHTEWGRTGQAPQHQTTGPFTKAVGVAAFAKQFQKKTGNKWDDRATAQEKPNKYKYVHRTTAIRNVYKWQYYMPDVNMHGERSGWYDYNAEASVTVNLICAQWVDNKDMPLRVVKSNYFEYFVDFSRMIQRNTQTGKERPIRRVTLDTGECVDD